ncbi:MAG TPA: response regulator [Burkholderiaceae bacterium]|nr:response regulator [Burkholderiaceae bacterium]
MTMTPELGLPMVYLVDDEEVVRQGIAWLLRSRRLLSEGFDSGEAFEAALEQHTAAGTGQDDWPRSPSCLVLDLRMGGMSGLALFERVIARGLLETLPVIFLTGHGDVPTAVAAVKRGAFDFVEKPFSNNALVDRVEQALAASGEALLKRREVNARQRRLEHLSKREREVMELVASGMSNKAMADALQVSVRTIEVHRASVYEKLGVQSAVELLNTLNSLNPPRA